MTSEAEIGQRRLKLDALIGRCRKLPTLPAIALQVLELAEDPEATLDRFAGLMAQDPALAGKLLRVANSSFYGHAREIATLAQAVQVLGLNAATMLALSFSLRRCASPVGGDSLDLDRYWRRSLLTALAARTLAVELRVGRPEEVFLAGLLRGIGILVMDSLFAGTYAKLYAGAAAEGELLRQECAAFGFQHVEAGARLLREWRLPERIARAVEGSYAMDSGRSTGVLAGCLGVGSQLADVCLTRADTEAFVRTGALAAEVLDLSANRFQAVIGEMARKVPGVESLFDVALIEPAWMEHIEASADELRLVRQLRAGAMVFAPEPRDGPLAHRVAMLEHEVQRDALTGLFNRAYLDRALEVEFSQVAEAGRPLSVAFADIDHFKAVNDRFGHAAGDQLLMAVARWLLRGVRQSDVVARYGGEEFIVLMPNTDLDTARAIMERILAELRSKPFRTDDGRDVTIALSVGVTAHGDGGNRYAGARDLLQAADLALYRAKRAGRGRVEVAPTPGDARGA